MLYPQEKWLATFITCTHRKVFLIKPVPGFFQKSAATSKSAMRHISCCQVCLLGNKTAGVEDVTSRVPQPSVLLGRGKPRKSAVVPVGWWRLSGHHAPLTAHPPHMLAAHRGSNPSCSRSSAWRAPRLNSARPQLLTV